MSRHNYQRDPDGTLSVETSAPTRHAKTAAVIPTDTAIKIAARHTRHRTDDQTIENLPGLTRATRDRNRNYPRNHTPSPNPRKEPRPLTNRPCRTGPLTTKHGCDIEPHGKPKKR